MGRRDVLWEGLVLTIRRCLDTFKSFPFLRNGWFEPASVSYQAARVRVLVLLCGGQQTTLPQGLEWGWRFPRPSGGGLGAVGDGGGGDLGMVPAQGAPPGLANRITNYLLAQIQITIFQTSQIWRQICLIWLISFAEFACAYTAIPHAAHLRDRAPKPHSGEPSEPDSLTGW